MALFHVSAPRSSYRLRSFIGGGKHTTFIFMIKELAHVDNDMKQGRNCSGTSDGLRESGQSQSQKPEKRSRID